MKEFRYSQHHLQLGELKGVCRIMGKILFFKFNSTPQAEQMISQLKMRGAEVTKGRDWISVNIFKDKDVVKLGEKEFDATKTSDEDIENILFDFYYSQYQKAGFTMEVKK